MVDNPQFFFNQHISKTAFLRLGVRKEQEFSQEELMQ